MIDGAPFTESEDISDDENNPPGLALQARLAKRVRQARERRGIPRRVLSEQSGVSQRYLAQLEAGAGNISIVLLQRVADALDYRIEWLVGEEDPETSELHLATELFRNASPEAQRAAVRLLGLDQDRSQRANRVCLLGLRGAGKSTLGAAVAEMLELPFVELNEEIARIGGMPVGEIIALYGDEGYRALEFEALEQVAESHTRVLMAASGGVVSASKTFDMLLSRYNTVWIKASPQEHMDRVRAQGDERPMAGYPRAMDQLKEILRSREVKYARAQAHLDTSGASLEQSLHQLLQVMRDNHFLR